MNATSDSQQPAAASGLSGTPHPTEPSILIFGDADFEERWRLKWAGRTLAKEAVPASTLHTNLATFLKAMQAVFTSLPDTVGAYQLDSLALSVEVSAKGNVSLLGIGGEVGGKSGLTFTFKRKT